MKGYDWQFLNGNLGIEVVETVLRNGQIPLERDEAVLASHVIDLESQLGGVSRFGPLPVKDPVSLRASRPVRLFLDDDVVGRLPMRKLSRRSDVINTGIFDLHRDT